jgi:hypothetical protein
MAKFSIAIFSSFACSNKIIAVSWHHTITFLFYQCKTTGKDILYRELFG